MDQGHFYYDHFHISKMKMTSSLPDSLYSTGGLIGVNDILSSSMSSPYVPGRSLAVGGVSAYKQSASGSSFAASGVTVSNGSGSGVVRTSYPAPPCVCYQAKEKEPLGDVLRRAGARCVSRPPSVAHPLTHMGDKLLGSSQIVSTSTYINIEYLQIG